MPQASDLLEVGLRRGFQPEQVRKALSVLDDYDVERLAWMMRWVDARHEFQVVPEGNWSNWVILAGRGSGKTRVGSEWTGMSAAMALPNSPGKPDRSLVVAPTKGDLRDVCFEGDSGLVSIIPPALIKVYHKTPAPRIELYNGNIIGGIAAEAFQRTRGPQWNRAWCLLGSSMVYMGDGSTKRLDCVRVGDYVMTREGARMVEWSGMTNPAADLIEVMTDMGHSIHGTMEHPIWTKEEGFICLSNLTQHHHVMCLPMVSAGLGVQTDTITDATESGHVQKVTRSQSTCTLRCMSGRLVRSLTDLLSTIATRIRATTSRLISKLCRGRTTIVPTPLEGQQALGSAPKPRCCVSNNGVTPSTSAVHASSVALSLNLGHKASLVSPAASNAWSVDAIATLNVVRHVRPLPGKHAVYNLKVQGTPEFFANGILVHNCDEVAAWGEGGKADPEEVWDTMVMSVRLGQDTRILVTTTPKPRPLVKRLVADEDSVLTSASTHVNAANLSPEFSRRIMKYDGTKVGRQEIYAELIDAEEGGIISRSWIKHWPGDKSLPEFHFIVMSLDTAFSEDDHDKKTQTTDPSACSVWGCFKLPSGKPGIMLLDCWAERLGFPELVEKVKSESDPDKIRYGSNLSQRPMITPSNVPKAYRKNPAPRVGGRPIDLIVIEGKASGKSLRQMLYKSDINSVQFNPTQDKLERGHFVSPIFKDGTVWVPDSPHPGKDGRPKFMSWAEPLVEQLCSYSGEGSVVHDDLYDSTTQAINVIDWYWLHQLRGKGQIGKSGNIQEDKILDVKTSTNPYAT